MTRSTHWSPPPMTRLVVLGVPITTSGESAGRNNPEPEESGDTTPAISAGPPTTATTCAAVTVSFSGKRCVGDHACVSYSGEPVTGGWMSLNRSTSVEIPEC